MKIRYSQWIKDRQISVNSLRFDPENPRLQGVAKNERAIIAALAETEDVAELLRKIARSGYAPIERTVAIYIEGKPIVIEGNRRLAVCKMLLDPEKAPPKLRGLVKQARNELGDAELPRKIGCDIPSDNAEAKVYAYMKHAEDKFFKPWAKIQQAVVESGIADAMERGEPVEVELTEAQIKEAKAMLEFYRLAGVLSRDDKNGIKAESLRDFPYEAVKRVFLAKESRAALGIKTDLKGIEIRGDLENFVEFYRKTLSKMGEGRATREFNTVDQAKEWIKNTGYKPDDDSPSRLSDGLDSLASNSQPSIENKDIKPKKVKAFVDRRKNKVFPEELTLEYNSLRLASVLDEVEKMKVEKQANTAGVMLRCVLELAVGAAFKQRSLEASYKAWLQANQDTLWKRIEWMRQTKPIPTDRDVDRLLNSLTNGRVGKVTLESLNGWVHSIWCPVASGDVRTKATELTPLLKVLLAKP